MPRIDHLPTVDSTNAEAMRRALAGEVGPLWILADAQTAGRGRAGRAWSSQTGNLQASFLASLPAASLPAYQLSLVAGVAAFDALSGALGNRAADLRLKWPNDILIGGSKAGGILIESSAVGGRLAVVIGIGVNVVANPKLEDRATACLAEFGATPDPWSLLTQIARAMEDWLAVWSLGRGFATVRSAWLDRAHPLGDRMAINTGRERISGAFAGLDEDGALLLDIDQGVRRFTFGDVAMITGEPDTQKG